MGMGGGILLIPGLTLIMGVGQHAAQGVNTLAFLPAAIVALIVHKKEGRLDIRALLPLLIAGPIFAVGGALLSGVIDAPWLKRLFGAGLIILACIRLLDIVKKNTHNAKVK